VNTKHSKASRGIAISGILNDHYIANLLLNLPV